VFLVGPPTLRRNRRQFETLHGRLCVTSQLSLICSALLSSLSPLGFSWFRV
jgi:hypothetical protein